MTLVIAHVSIEGASAIMPGTVFDADEKLLKHLSAANAVTIATEEEIVLAKARGRFIEPAPEKPAAEKAAPEKPAKKTETKGDSDKKSDEDL